MNKGMYRVDENVRLKFTVEKSSEIFEHICSEYFSAINEQVEGILRQVPQSNENHQIKDAVGLISKPLEQLQSWRDRMNNLIDSTYNETKTEMIQLVESHLQKQEQTTNLSDLSTVKNPIEGLQDPFTCLDQSKNIDFNQITSNCLKTLEPFGYDIHFQQHFRLASNGKIILFYQFGCLFLIDRQGSILRQLFWREDSKFDACWSSILQKFIFIGHHGKSLWTMDDSQTSPERLLDSDGLSFCPLEKSEWEYIACSKTNLYLSTANQIDEYALIPTVKFHKRHQISSINEIITSINHNDQNHLALLIRRQSLISYTNDRKIDIHFEIRQTPTFHQLHYLTFDDSNSSDIVLCCALFQQNSGWLLLDLDYSRFLYVTEHGQLNMTIDQNRIQIKSAIQCGDILVGTSENSAVYFFQLQLIKS